MKNILLSIVFAFALVSCVKVEPHTFEATNDLIKAPCDMDFYPIVIVKSEYYTIETNCDWVIVDTVVNETTTDRIIFKCFMNPTTKYRCTNIDIEGETFSKQINVVQPGKK